MLVSKCWIRIRLSMCAPQIECDKEEKKNLNESDKVSSSIWVPIDRNAAGGGKNQGMCQSCREESNGVSECSEFKKRSG